MYVKKLFKFLTLRSALVSAHRKRQFVLTATLLVAVLFFRAFSVALVTHLPYAIKVIDVITYTLLTNVTINALRIFIVSSHRQRREISNEEHDNFTVGVNAIVNAATVFAVILFIFIFFDIEVRSFLSSIAIFAVALTLIFQEFIKNFLFGFAIMFSADYEIGDYVQIGTSPKGVIRNITFSSVQLKTENGDVLYIPNSFVQAHEVLNFSKLKPRRISSEFRLLRSQVNSVAIFEKQLLEYLEKTYPATFEIEKCHVHVKESDKEEIVFTLEASTRKASLKLKEQVNHSVQRFAVEYK